MMASCPGSSAMASSAKIFISLVEYLMKVLESAFLHRSLENRFLMALEFRIFTFEEFILCNLFFFIFLILSKQKCFG